MAKEKLVTIHVHTPFTLTLGDLSKQEFGRGRHNVPEEVASHWFTRAHAELSESGSNETDDQQPVIDSLQAQIADKDKLIADLKTDCRSERCSAQAAGAERQPAGADYFRPDWR